MEVNRETERNRKQKQKKRSKSSHFLFSPICSHHFYFSCCALKTCFCPNCSWLADLPMCLIMCCITATPPPTHRSISHTPGSEFQKSSLLGCFQQWVMRICSFFPHKCRRTAVTPHTYCCLGSAPAHSLWSLVVSTPTLLTQSPVCRAQILETDLAESSGWGAILRKWTWSPQHPLHSE